MDESVGFRALDEAVSAPRARALRVPAVRVDASWLPWLALASVVGLSFTLNVWSLSSAGYGNTYYAAAVRSMTVSWKNFFFGAFDPGGFITVDKPPVFLWFGAVSARVFGYSTWSILLPSAFAGAASVALLWLITRRYFGTMGATIAGMVLALSPISVAVNRLNLPEPFMILFLVGAAGATIRSLESKRWWAWTVLAGCLVGMAFNVKMLAAWIPGPAFALAIVVATRAITWVAARELAGRLALLAAATFIVSASWMAVVDLWPKDARPYIGGSTDNTVRDLALGYNGFGRVEGTGQLGFGGGGPRGFPGGYPPDFLYLPNAAAGDLPGGALPGAAGQTPGGALPLPSGGGVPGQPPTGQFRGYGAIFPGGTNGQGAPANGGRGLFGPGGVFGGVASPLRMFDDANGGQIGWLLPFALGGSLLALWHWRAHAVRRAFVVLFLGWVVIHAGVFSIAEGIYHSYYTSAMAPGVAALVGAGSVAAVEAIGKDKRWLIAPLALIGLTVWAQLEIAGRTPDFYGWVRPFTVSAAMVGVAVLAVATLRGGRFAIWLASAGVAVSIAGLLLLPAAWSASAAANAALNATLPQAGPQVGASGATFGSLAFDDGTGELAVWLKENGDPGATWDVVVSSSQNGSRLIAQYGLSAMSLGGFLGSDNTISVDDFANLVSSGEVRYVLVQGGGLGGFAGRFGTGAASASDSERGSDAVLPAVQEACAVVTDAALPAEYEGGLYDCAGKADALRATGG